MCLIDHGLPGGMIDPGVIQAFLAVVQPAMQQQPLPLQSHHTAEVSGHRCRLIALRRQLAPLPGVLQGGKRGNGTEGMLAVYSGAKQGGFEQQPPVWRFYKQPTESRVTTGSWAAARPVA